MDVGLILLLGIFFYFILQRSVAGITRTPIWLLWLVMMSPPFIWLLWAILFGTQEKVPLLVVIVSVLGCSFLYWYLVQRGRTSPSRSAVTSDGSPEIGTSTPLTKQAPLEKTSPRLLTPAEETVLQQCFPWNIYYLQQMEYRPQAVLCRGQLRVASDQAYQTIQQNVQQQFGDRFFVAFQEGLNGKPFFALVPNPQVQPEAQKQSQNLNRPVLMLFLLFVTLLTTTQAGLQMLQLPVDSLQKWESLKSALPYAISLMTILGLHELGHYCMTRVYRVRATLPYFLPVPVALFPLGTLGAFIQIRSPIPNRKALFDVGIAGPITGLIATIPLLIMGLMQSRVVDIPEQTGLFKFEAIIPSSSTLFLILGKLALGAQLTADHALELHPMAIAGYLGLLVTALNLMPVGQLDGGHIIHAMLGQRGGMMIGQIARFLFLLLALLVRREFLLWALLLFLLPSVDEPALNNVTELDNRRDLLGILAITVLLLIILPAPGALVKVLLG